MPLGDTTQESCEMVLDDVSLRGSSALKRLLRSTLHGQYARCQMLMAPTSGFEAQTAALRKASSRRCYLGALCIKDLTATSSTIRSRRTEVTANVGHPNHDDKGYTRENSVLVVGEVNSGFWKWSKEFADEYRPCSYSEAILPSARSTARFRK